MIDDRAFFLRGLGLLAFLGAGAALDRWRYGAEATRAREYLFLLGCGAAGAAFATGLDHLEATASPEYFVHGKLLDPDVLRYEVTLLAVHAGLIAGLVAGGLLLLANQPRADRPQLSYRQLARQAAWPFLGALVLATPGALVALAFDPLDLGKRIAFDIGHRRVGAFLTVWGIHLGLYAGAALGAIAGVVSTWRRRGTLERSTPDQPA